MTRTIIVTDHAISRYRERVENCSKEDAEDRIAHAVEIAIPCPPAIEQRVKSRGSRRPGSYFLYCPVERLVLICRNSADGGVAVMTVFRLETKAR